MKYCGECGSPTEDSNKFCNKCGTAFPVSEQEVPHKQAPQQAPPSPNIASGKQNFLLPLVAVGGVGIAVFLAVQFFGNSDEVASTDSSSGSAITVQEQDPNLEPFPYDLVSLLDMESLELAMAEDNIDYLETWQEGLQIIPEPYLLDLIVGAGSIAAGYYLGNQDMILEGALIAIDDQEAKEEFWNLAEFKMVSSMIPAELETLSITWDTSLTADSGVIPFTAVVNGEPFLADPTVKRKTEYDIYEPLYNFIRNDNLHGNISLEQALDMLSFVYFELEDALVYVQEHGDRDNILGLMYASTEWAKIEPFVLEVERTSETSFDVYTSSSHWAQLGLYYQNGEASEILSVIPEIAKSYAVQYQKDLEYNREQADFTVGISIAKAMRTAMAHVEADHAGQTITWQYGSQLTSSHPDSDFYNEFYMTVGPLSDPTTEFGIANPLVLVVGIDGGGYYTYVDSSSNQLWAEKLNLPWGPQ